ncbi:PAS domain S-box protein [Planococcus liqunii]|uniref:PAS domain S-box protein n=1 Tax=Planococcus liqunii TaxID=3058394 RepID=A0ABT8MN22_9BACL|nr:MULTISPECIES: PAS domain S-box protein [unclassified Planococcus (in: firmicutes)]MDN7226294.1 PAS domain S-box protein [Planococcus sp. N064]WKA50071.1 PAS domain S-box protein [Planococcus sp. N056]
MNADFEAIPFAQILMDGIQEMVFIVKMNNMASITYEFISKTAMENTGLNENALGKTLREVHSEEKAAHLKTLYAKALESGEAVCFKDDYYTAGGERRWCSTRMTAIVNEAKKYTYIVSVVKDITKEKMEEAEKNKAWKQLEEGTSRYRSLFEKNGDAIFTIDMAGQIRTGNLAVEKISGYKMSDLIGKNLADYLVVDNRTQVHDYLEQASSDAPEDFRIHLVHVSGKQIGCLMKMIAIEIDGKTTGYYAILKDMTELDKLASKYAGSEERFRIIAENAQDVIVLLNELGECLYVSPSCQTVYGVLPDEAIRMRPLSFIHPNDLVKLEEAFEQSMLSGKSCKLRLRILHQTKGWIWSELHGTPVFDDQNQFIHKVLILRDVTQQRQRERELEYYAYHDSLTGLPNRRMLSERLTAEIEAGTVFALMVLDMDDFKKINDEWGHETGDAVILEFSKRLTNAIGKSDIAARLGGDEFVILLFDANTEEKVRLAADKIHEALERPWFVQGINLKVAASMGAALAPFEGVDSSSLFKNADRALYEVKKAGKNYLKINGSKVKTPG